MTLFSLRTVEYNNEKEKYFVSCKKLWPISSHFIWLFGISIFTICHLLKLTQRLPSMT